MNTNVMGTVKVLEAARKAKVKKFVYAASSSCYGLAKTPTSEIHKINPLYPYAMSKYQGEKLCFHWSKLYNLPVNSLRIFNAYGPRVRTTGAYGAVFGVFFKQKLEKNGYWNTRVLQSRRLFFNWLPCFINLTWSISFFWISRPYPNNNISPIWMKLPNYYGNKKHSTSAKKSSRPRNFMTGRAFGPNSVKLSASP